MSKAVRALVLLLSVLAIAVSTLSLASCDRRYDEGEVLSNATRLLKQAEVLNEVYYGRGIQYITTGYRDGNYYEADGIHLSLLGFSTIRELENMTRETFTKGYSEQIFDTKLSVIEDSTGIQHMTRYYQRYDAGNVGEPICIMVYSEPTVSLTDKIEYDYSSMRVSGVRRQTVYVTVSAVVTNEEGKSQTRDVRLSLIEEDDGWRIDSPCYVSYSDSLDRYNELENKK